MAKALLADEEELKPLGIKVGILGQPRNNYDVLLMRLNKDAVEPDEETDVDLEKEKWEKRDSEGVQKRIVSFVSKIFLFFFSRETQRILTPH